MSSVYNRTYQLSGNGKRWLWYVKNNTNAVVTPLRKAALYEPRIAILGIWGDTWLTRGKYDIYVVLTGPLQGLRDTLCHIKSALSTAVSSTWR